MSKNSNFLCVYFSKDNTYTVVNDSKGLCRHKSKANVKDLNGSWVVGDIRFRGTENQCIKYGKSLEDSPEYVPTDDDESELDSHDENFQCSKTLKELNGKI